MGEVSRRAATASESQHFSKSVRLTQLISFLYFYKIITNRRDLYLLPITVAMSTEQSGWKEKVAAKRVTQLNCIPKEWRISDSLLKEYRTRTDGVLKVPEECGILSTKELQVTGEYDAVGISEELETGRLSSKEVTTAFCKRAAIAHQLVR